MADEDETDERDIGLAPGDGCVIVRGVGTFQMLLPHTEEGENLSPNHTLMAGFALGLGLQDQRMIDVLWQLLEEKRQEAEAKGKG